MHLLPLLASTTLLSLTHALPAPVDDAAANGYGANFKFPLSNGFPNPNANQLAAIEQTAGGTLPNGAAPPDPGATGALDFMVIATNELTEVAFFTEFLHNVTNGVPGYKVPAGLDYSYVVESLKAIKHQEMLHALAANSVLAAYNYPTVAPCAYTFPVTDFASAAALAGTFTDLVLGALQSVQTDLVAAGNGPLAQVLSSIIGQEGEQDGFYRFTQKKVPSAAPFLTNSNGIFAYNALLQLFIVPGSCPSSNPSQLNQIPKFGTLNLMTMPKPKNMTLTYMVQGTVDSTDCVTYMSGQNTPVTVSIDSIKTSNGMTTFTAEFPYMAGFSRGLTVAAVTSGSGPYANAVDVAMATSFGPGLVEVQ